MKALANLMAENIWWYSFTVIAIFLALQIVYFLAARRMYVTKIRQYALA
jgi:putative ABC transport system permease protein